MKVFALVVIGLLALNSQAAAQIGTVTELKGSGEIVRESNVIGDSSGIELESMDTARTERGKMRLDFIDDTRVDVIENSILVIDDFVYDPASGTGKLDMRAALGTVRYASGQIAKKYKQNVKIRTPSATIGVRGTDFVMVVDEVGGSLITLLPSCDTSGVCYTGEITVETDAGIVIMNQAFQATATSTSASPPSPPKLLDLPEDMIDSLLIIRKRVPWVEDEAEWEKAKRQAADILGVDFLEFGDLDLQVFQSDDEIWHTELDETDFMLGDLLVDILEQLNIQLAQLFKDEFEKQQKTDFSGVKLGFDATTGIRISNVEPYYVFERYDNVGTNNVYLKLHKQSGGYTLNVQQGDFEIFDYRIGNGPNNIDIYQTNN